MTDNEPRATGALLQALVLRCDGVDYMFFGPPVFTGDDDVPNVESLSFGGFMPVSHMVELLQRTTTTLTPDGSPTQ